MRWKHPSGCMWISELPIKIFFIWRSSPQWVRAYSFSRFLDHTRRITVGRTPLDEWSARRREEIRLEVLIIYCDLRAVTAKPENGINRKTRWPVIELRIKKWKNRDILIDACNLLFYVRCMGRHYKPQDCCIKSSAGFSSTSLAMSLIRENMVSVMFV
jgi:hypothetical protein